MESATVVMRRAAAYHGFSASSAAASSVRYAFSTEAISAAVSVSVSWSGIDGGSTSSSGFSDTHRHLRAVLNISPASTRWFLTVFGDRPAAIFWPAYRSNSSGDRESRSRSKWPSVGRRCSRIVQP